MNTVNEIYEELKDAFEAEAGITLNDSGDMALRFRALAAQLVSLQAQAEYAQRQCFPQTATGEALDSHALQRGLSRKPAEKASGTLRFSVSAPAVSEIAIPAGTRCVTPDEMEFTVTEGGVIAVGSTYADVAAEAVTAGAKGNIAADSTVFMELPPVGVSGCAVPAAFSGGCDEESDDALRARVLESYRSIANSGNAAYYRQLALNAEGIAAVSVQPRHRGRGTVDITIATAEGVPSTAVLSRVSSLFNGRREICVDVDVKAPTTHAVDVTAEISVESGYDGAEVCARVEEALENHFTGAILGKGVKLAELGSIIFAVEGVENYAVSEPTADLAASPTVLPVLGELDISEAEA